MTAAQGGQQQVPKVISNTITGDGAAWQQNQVIQNFGMGQQFQHGGQQFGGNQFGGAQANAAANANTEYGQDWMNMQQIRTPAGGLIGQNVSHTTSIEIIKPIDGGNSNVQHHQSFGNVQFNHQQAAGIKETPAIIPLPIIQNPQINLEAERAAYAARLSAQKSEQEIMQLHLQVESLNKRIADMNEEQRKLHAQSMANLQKQTNVAQQIGHVPQGGVNFVTGMTGGTLGGFDMAGTLPVTGKLDASGRQKVSGTVQASGTIQLTGFIDTAGTMETSGNLTTQGHVKATPQVQNFQVQYPMQQFHVSYPNAQIVSPPAQQPMTPFPGFEAAKKIDQNQNLHPRLAVVDQPETPKKHFTGLLPVEIQKPITPEVTPGQSGPSTQELMEMLKNVTKKIEVIENNFNKNAKHGRTVSFKEENINFDDQSFTRYLRQQIGDYISMTADQDFNDNVKKPSGFRDDDGSSQNQSSRSRNRNVPDSNARPKPRNIKRNYKPEVEEDHDDDTVEEVPEIYVPPTTPRVVRPPAYRSVSPIVVHEQPTYVREEPVVVVPIRPQRVSYVPVETTFEDYFPVQVESANVYPAYVTRSQPRLEPRYVAAQTPSYGYVPNPTPATRNSIFGIRGSTYYPNVVGTNVTYGTARSAQFFNQTMPSSTLGGDSYKSNTTYFPTVNAKTDPHWSFGSTMNSANSPALGNNPRYDEQDIAKRVGELVARTKPQAARRRASPS